MNFWNNQQKMSYGYWPKEEEWAIKRSWHNLGARSKISLMLFWLGGYIVISVICLVVMSVVFGVAQNRFIIPLNLNFLDILWMIPWYGLILGECGKYVLWGREIWLRRFVQAVMVVFLLLVLSGLAGFDVSSRTTELVATAAMSLVFWPTAWVFWTQWFGRYAIGE